MCPCPVLSYSCPALILPLPCPVLLLPSPYSAPALFLPCPTLAEAERSFSKLRRVKSWLRSTMVESRLSDLLVCYVHQRMLDGVDIARVMRSFIATDDNRRRAFGDV